MSTLLLLASEQFNHSALLLATCCYSGLVGLVALLRLTYSRHLASITNRYVYVSLSFGLMSLLLFLVIAPGVSPVVFSLVLAQLSTYAVWRWHTNKSKYPGVDTAADV